MREIVEFFKEVVSQFGRDRCSAMAAALSYYTVFSLPPLLVILVAILGLFFGEDAAQGKVAEQLELLLGIQARSALEVQELIEAASGKDEGLFATALGLVGLVIGASGVFAQLQGAMNEAWNVAPDPERSGILTFLIKRVLSFGMILGIGFLLLVSLAFETILSAFGAELAEALGAVAGPLVWFINISVSFVAITGLFALMFKVIPDAKIGWRDVGVGAAITAALFIAGRAGIALYLGQSSPGSAYGAAGSLALLLAWVYIAALIFFLGVEITQVWAVRYGDGIEPEKGAVRVTRELMMQREGEAPQPMEE